MPKRIFKKGNVSLISELGTAKEKMDALSAVGVEVVVSPAEIGKAVKKVLTK